MLGMSLVVAVVVDTAPSRRAELVEQVVEMEQVVILLGIIQV